MEDSDLILLAFTILLVLMIFWGVCTPGGTERLAPQLARALGSNKDLSYESHIGPGYYPTTQ
jgi:outer membrane lipoprotein-sorting protein